ALYADRPGGGHVQVPILINLQLAAFSNLHTVARHELAYALVERLLAGEISEGQILREVGRIELRVHRAMRENHLDLRAEQERIGREPVIERLNSQTVAGDKQRALFAVPDGKSEHAAQIVNAVAAVLLVEMDDGLRVAVGAIPVATRFELTAQLSMVVDFAVKDNPDRTALVGDGLVPARNVND